MGEPIGNYYGDIMKMTGKMMGRSGRLRVTLNYLMYETLNKTWDTKTNDSRANQSKLNSTRNDFGQNWHSMGAQTVKQTAK